MSVQLQAAPACQFLSQGAPKTLARIEQMLETGKPLRN